MGRLLKLVYSEASLRGDLLKLLRNPRTLPNFVVLRHEDQFESGHPDFSVTGNHITSWFEIKYLRPSDSDIRSRGIQDFTLLRLGCVSKHVFYIIYDNRKNNPITRIIHATQVAKWKEDGAGVTAVGFNHMFVVEFIRGHHGSDKHDW